MPETKSPDEKLAELKKQLADSDGALSELTKKRDALKSNVEALSKIVEDITKTSAGFGQGEAGLKGSKQEHEKYLQTKKQMVETVLGEETKRVISEITKVDNLIETKRGTVNALKASAKKAEGDFEATKGKLQERQRAYDDLKDIRKHLGEKLQKLKDYKTQIEQFDEQSKPASMYVLLIEFKKVLDETQIPSQSEYQKQLNAASEALEAAKAEVAAAKLGAEATREKLAKEEDALKALEQHRIEDILKAVDKLEVDKPEAGEPEADELEAAGRDDSGPQEVRESR